MKEYEFIIKAIEYYLSDQLVATICRESYEQVGRIGGFQNIFREYGKLHQIYSLKDDKELTLFLEQMEEMRMERLDSFVDDLAEEKNGLDINSLKDKYINELKKEDAQTVGKRVYIYPYLVEQMRFYNSKRKGEEYGEEI